jgi:hypothetical protein
MMPPGAVFGVGEKARHFAAGRIVEEIEERRPRLLGCGLDQVGRVVGRQQAHPAPAVLGRQGREELGRIGPGQAQEELLGLIPDSKPKPRTRSSVESTTQAFRRSSIASRSERRRSVAMSSIPASSLRA